MRIRETIILFSDITRMLSEMSECRTTKYKFITRDLELESKYDKRKWLNFISGYDVIIRYRGRVVFYNKFLTKDPEIKRIIKLELEHVRHFNDCELRTGLYERYDLYIIRKEISKRKAKDKKIANDSNGYNTKYF